MEKFKEFAKLTVKEGVRAACWMAAITAAVWLLAPEQAARHSAQNIALLWALLTAMFVYTARQPDGPGASFAIKFEISRTPEKPEGSA